MLTSSQITSIAESVMDDVKVYIGATWSDSDADQNILHDIESGVRELSRIGGDGLEFTDNADGSRALLFNYVLYARSGSIHEFRNNYREELVNLALDARIADMGEDDEDES